MEIGEGSVAVDAKAAREMQPGVADDDPELINFGGGGCVAHSHNTA